MAVTRQRRARGSGPRPRFNKTYECWFLEVPVGSRVSASGTKRPVMKTRHFAAPDTDDGYAAALAALEAFRAEIEEDKRRAADPASSYTLRMAIEAWLEWVVKTPEVGESTRDKYRGQARNRIYPAFDGTLLADVTYPMLMEFFETVAPDLGKDALKDLKHIIRHAIWHAAKNPEKTGFSGLNPASDIKLPAPGREPRDYDFLSLKQVEHVLKTVRAHPEKRISRMYALILVGCLFGLRPGELRALKWEHVDFADRAVYVLKWARKGGDGKTKTKLSRRGLEMIDIIFEALWELSDGGTARGYVFTDADGEQYTAHGLRRDVAAAFESAGFPGMDPYSMRHTAVSIMYDAGMTFKEIYPITGHANEVILASIYAHRLNPRVTETRKLNAIAGGMEVTGRVHLAAAA